MFRHTRQPWELIVVDNGSIDGTAEFLAGVPACGRGSVLVSVTVIRNEENRGFPAAVNQGLRAARGVFLMLLKNDAVVTEGWLDHLVGLSAVTRPDDDTAGGDRGGEGDDASHGIRARHKGGISGQAPGLESSGWRLRACEEIDSEEQIEKSE